MLWLLAGSLWGLSKGKFGRDCAGLDLGGEVMGKEGRVRGGEGFEKEGRAGDLGKEERG